MLHQPSARSDQREGTDPVVDRRDAVLIEMREAQLDNIAIPKLFVLGVNLLMAERREGAAETMGVMLGAGVIAEQAQPLVEVVRSESARSPLRENM
jgi:hypothetical protein